MSDTNNPLRPMGGGTPDPPAPSPQPANAGGMSPLQSAAPQPAAASAPAYAPPPATYPPLDAPTPNAQHPAPTPFEYEEKSGFNRPLIYAVLGTGLAAALTALLFFFQTPGAALVPSEFDDFTSADNTYAIQTPKGWDKRASGEAAGDSNGTQANGVFLKSGGAHMEVTFSTVKGLVEGQLLYGKDITPEAMTGSRASGVDKLQKPAVKRKFKGYAEKKVEDVPSGMNASLVDMEKKTIKADATMYEFTATGDSWGMGGPVHGYRAVLAGQDLIAAVVCYAPEKEFEKLKPSFLKFIESVHELGKKGEDDGSGIPGGGSMPNTNVPVGVPPGLAPGGG